MSSYPQGAGDVVQQIFELRRLMTPKPKDDAMLFVGYLLGGKDTVRHETVERDLILTRLRDGTATLYSLEVEENGVVTEPFSAFFDKGVYNIDTFKRGIWEADLALWYRTARTAPKLLTSGELVAA
jgi:hypothetical protein